MNNPVPSIALLQSQSLPGLVQQEIERMILSGPLQPGDKLNEADLAQRLGVSRGPVREALRTLEEAGLVRQERNRGAFVRDVTVEEALEIYAVRASLEEMTGRLLASSVSREQLQDLRTITDAMNTATSAGSFDEYHTLNLRFHDRLVELTGNRKLLSVYRRLVKELALWRRRNLAGQSALAGSAAEHRQILKAIASGDAELAARTLAAHVHASRDRMQQAALSAPAGEPHRRAG
jgi:phosphonate utilization transcriptional regulator